MKNAVFVKFSLKYGKFSLFEMLEFPLPCNSKLFIKSNICNFFIKCSTSCVRNMMRKRRFKSVFLLQLQCATSNYFIDERFLKKLCFLLFVISYDFIFDTIWFLFRRQIRFILCKLSY